MPQRAQTYLLAISGSLRARSSNAELLRALRLLAAPRFEVRLYEGLGELPHFNPDLDGDGAVLPQPVAAFRQSVDGAAALVISSPEYAHGVPGALKNALDWLVSGPEIIYKPISLLNASPRSTHAQAALAETLRTMSTVLVDEACIALPISGRALDADAIVKDDALRTQLEAALSALAAATPAYFERRVELFGEP
ncbi:MAG TPA: NADPH-dependent FMN reductase [Gemmatimonadaceae bacterium]|nr:NADPH-dependent FMN reductase [Gemmatimonadaceae bacterium]